MLNNKIYVDSVGITISLTCRDNHYNLITFAPTDKAYICIKRPDGYEFEWPATINQSTVSYVTQDGDLEIAGDYIYQVKIVSQNGNVFYSEAQKFTVYKQFE